MPLGVNWVVLSFTWEAWPWYKRVNTSQTQQECIFTEKNIADTEPGLGVAKTKSLDSKYYFPSSKYTSESVVT